jgi:hypothetical protein
MIRKSARHVLREVLPKRSARMNLVVLAKRRRQPAR